MDSPARLRRLMGLGRSRVRRSEVSEPYSLRTNSTPPCAWVESWGPFVATAEAEPAVSDVLGEREINRKCLLVKLMLRE